MVLGRHFFNDVCMMIFSFISLGHEVSATSSHLLGLELGKILDLSVFFYLY